MIDRVCCLAVECATFTGGVALVAPGAVIAERLLDVRATYAERLLPAIEALLAEAGVALDALAAIGVSVGPGSFTGLRIGLATVQGLAAPRGIPLAGVGTLEALAWNAWGAEAPIVPVLDARRGELYAAAYRCRGEMPEELVAPRAAPPEELAMFLRERFARAPEPPILTGPGRALLAGPLAAAGAVGWRIAPDHIAAPRPASVATLALGRFSRGELRAGERPVPVYLRPSAVPPPEGVTLASMRGHHLDEVVRIERTVFSDPWTRALFEEELANPALAVTRVAERAGTVVGYVVAWIVLDELHVGNVAVAPRARRAGVATALVKELLGLARHRGCTRATLEVRVSNEAAIALYRGFGFRPVAMRRAYYRDNGEDALIMMADLVPEEAGSSA